MNVIAASADTRTRTWANIETATGDREIAAIDRLRDHLGTLPENVLQVRELITRFEVCHFKRDEHYRHIRRSIAGLHPVVEIDEIGYRHPRHGASAARTDTTGRSQAGLEYISALQRWLGSSSPEDLKEQRSSAGVTPVAERQVGAWIGGWSQAKERLVRMLLARLLWDWETMREHQSTEELEGLEYQIAATDICHYTFPRNLERIVQAIGKLEPMEKFEGCGTYCRKIDFACRLNYAELCKWLKAGPGNKHTELGTREPTRAWLVACLAKTLKEGLKQREPLPPLTPWMV